MTTLARRARSVGLAAAFLAIHALPAGAQPAPAGVQMPVSADPKLEYEALFQRILREPNNIDLNFRFAEIATKLGDYEAAVGALERIVFYNPNLPRVKLELGVLYFRLGAYEMSRSYFEGAVASPDAPDDIRARVETFLVEIDRRLATTRWSGYAQIGLRYQTNANAGPNGQLVRVLGRDAVLDRQFVNRPDWNAFALGTVRHVYDFENQRGDVWETSLTGYYARQFKIERLNLGLVELQTGPRLALAPGDWPGLAVRPYLIGNAVSLGDEPYFTTLGAGLSVSMPVGTALIEPFVEVRRRNFESTGDYPFASEQRGTLVSAGVLAQGPILGSILRWQARAAYSHNAARRDYYSYDQFTFDAGMPFEFDGPWGGSRRWTIVPTAGFTYASYDDPNVLIDPTVSRRDTEWRVGAILDAQVHEWFGLGVQVQYSVTDSNLPNYDTRNFSVTVGPTVRF